MCDWFGTGLGTALLDAEQTALTPWHGRLFGQQVLQVGCATGVSLLTDTPAAMKISFAPAWDDEQPAPVADNAALPLESDSMDTVLVHHALDFAPDSHRLLREAARVTAPGGRMLIIGFNPVSLWGLGRLMRKRHAPWNGRFIALQRIQDWLRLLGFQMEDIGYGGFLLPYEGQRMLRRAAQYEQFGHRYLRPLGGFYLITARKQVMPLTPAGSRWPRLRHPVLGSPAVNTGRMAAGRAGNVVPLRWDRNSDGERGPVS
jgi:SAM-dependent methyltransferase